MDRKRKTPEPLAGGDRGSKIDFVGAKIFQENNPNTVNNQPTIDPRRNPILHRHWPAQAEAIPPSRLREIVTEAIEARQDVETYNAVLARELKTRERLVNRLEGV